MRLRGRRASRVEAQAFSATDTATHVATMRPDGTLFGEGQGVQMGKGGEAATWVGHGVGTFRKDGGISYRGACYDQSAPPTWSRLNSIAAVFEYEIDARATPRARSGNGSSDR